MIIYTLNTHTDLEKEIFQKVQAEAGSFTEKSFNNGEYCIKIGEDVKGKKVVVLAIITDPKEQAMKVQFLLNALKSNKASKITLVMPYFPYSRQDRVHEAGQPISCELMASLYTAAGASKIITLDIHKRSGLGKSKKAVKNIDTTELISKAIKQHIDSSWVLVAPDFGAKKRVNSIAKDLKIKNTAYLKKTRPQPGEAKILEINGDSVKDKKVMIIDDMIDTASTLIKASNFLREAGAKQVMASATHAIFSGDAIKKINQSVIMKLFCSNSLPLNQAGSGKLVVFSCADTLVKTIKKHV